MGTFGWWPLLTLIPPFLHSNDFVPTEVRTQLPSGLPLTPPVSGGNGLFAPFHMYPHRVGQGFLEDVTRCHHGHLSLDSSASLAHHHAGDMHWGYCRQGAWDSLGGGGAG